MPLAIFIFDLPSNMVLAVVKLGASCPVLLAIVHGLARMYGHRREVSAGLHLSAPDFVMKIGLANALPDILTGRRFSWQPVRWAPLSLSGFLFCLIFLSRLS